MSEDTSEQSDEPRRPLRGTASQPNPFSDESPPEHEGEEDVTITINAPDGSVREYKLTERVKGYYEDAIEESFESKDVEWYEMWWEGPELVIEYEGKVRDMDMRPGGNDQQQQNQGQAVVHQNQDGTTSFAFGGGQQQQQDPHLPRDMRPPFAPRRGVPQIFLPIPDQSDGTNRFDESMVPVWNKTSVNVQRRANKNPLMVEDLFIEAWDPDSEGQDPINSEHADGEVDYEITDFRDETDDREETVRKGARGNRWNI